ncbi:MAG: 2-oxoacid:acceptor oxidoreductase family protein [Lachnospiraceae bacterium]|nr:2-oxoacid:acceptor oxidoreductase family protein [Lachnospiraceae bacterium]
MAQTGILFAGFGGQGILFSGKFLAYEGLISDKQVSWLPSYGPEMRGGTASCSVVFSDEVIGSPIVEKPDILVVMNLPSLDKYESAVVPGGKIFYDCSLIDRKVNRTDVQAFAVPATKMAADNGMPTLANMILVGKMIKETGLISTEHVEKIIDKIVSARHQDLKELNAKAIKMGYDYEA